MRRLVRLMWSSAAAGALLVVSNAGAHAQSIVVRSTGPSAPSHPKGQRLPQGATVTLRAGDVVTILDKVGTRVLRGPGTFRLDAAVVRDNGLAVRLSRSLGDPAALRTTLRAGAVRGMGGSAAAASPDTIWLADVDAGGNVCVPKGSAAYLWRGNATGTRGGSLGTPNGGVKVSVQWPAQTSSVVWPGRALPLADGSIYRFIADGPSTKVVEFKIVTIDPAIIPADAAGLGMLLLDRGCTTQFDRLASSLQRGGAPGSKGGN